MYKIYLLEKQSGILRLILYLYDNGESLLSSIWSKAQIGINQGYKALEKGRELDLIATRVDYSTYPRKNMISLTVKGKEVAKYLKKIEEVLGGDQQ